MKYPCRWAGWACLLSLGLVSMGRADTPDPLRLIPAEADLVVKIENPAAITETIYNLRAFKEVQKIDAVREIYDSTNFRRFNQLVAYFEKQLDADKYTLLDKLAGGGVVFAVKAQNDPPVMLVIQGKDEKTTKQFIEHSLEIAEAELARQESKQKIKRVNYKGAEGVRIGPFYMGRIGATLIISNKGEVVKAAVDLDKGKGKSVTSNKNLAQAKKMLDANPLAWAWVNLASIRKQKGAEQLFSIPKIEPILNINFLPPMIDLARRSPYLVTGFYQRDNRFLYTLRFPRGLKGMPKYISAYFPRGKVQALPLLEPPNVLSSSSVHMDTANWWKNRKDAMKPEQLQQIEQFDKISGRFLGGVKLSQVLLQAGSQFRVVVTQPTETVYKKRKPSQPQQAFGVVHQMRDPALGKTLNRMLRTVALVGAAGFNVKMVEERHGDILLVTYRFPEDRDFPGDTLNIRYAFSPCFAQVGNQFMVASTVELGRDLIKVLQNEKDRTPLPFMARSKAYSKGLAAVLETTKEQLLTQFVLSQAHSIEEAKKQIETLINFVEDLGTAEAETVYNANDFRLNLFVDLKK